MSAPAASRAAMAGWIGVTARDIADLAARVTCDGRRVPSPAEALAAKTVVAQRASQYADGWFGDDAEAVRVALVGAAWAATGLTMSALTGIVALGGSVATDLPDLPSWVGDRLRAELGQQPVARRG